MSTSLSVRVHEEGRRAWPGIEIELEKVRDCLERHPKLSSGPDLRTADLYLVCACLCGNDKAQAQLETLCREELRSALRKLRASVDEEDVVATLLSKLLVAKPGSEPKLKQYLGRSELRQWLQVVVLRHVLNANRGSKARAPLEEAMMAGISSDLPEWKCLDTSARRSFREALGRALRELSPRDRLLLRHRLSGLSMDAIAALFGIGQATVSRWFARVSISIEHSVRRELRDALRLRSDELDSLVRSMLSQVDASIREEVSRAFKEASR
jgi:RNA polymerase sigma-70 factor